MTDTHPTSARAMLEADLNKLKEQIKEKRAELERLEAEAADMEQSLELQGMIRH